jgi:uncharacterized membrane protein YgcG
MLCCECCRYTISPNCVKILLTTWAASTVSDAARFDSEFQKAMVDLLRMILGSDSAAAAGGDGGGGGGGGGGSGSSSKL